MSTFPRGATLLLPLALLLHAGCGEDPFRVANTDFSAEETVTFEVPVTTQTSFLLLGINGNITVDGDPDATVISVEARKIVQSESVEDAEANLERLQVGREETQERITLETEQPEKTGGRDFIVFYTITVPDSDSVLVSNINGMVEIDGIRAQVIAQNLNGPVSLTDIVGGAAAALGNGNLQASVTLPQDENIDFGLSNGSISLTIPTDTSAEFFAIVSNGTIVLNNLTLHDEVRTFNSLEGRLGEGKGSIVLGTGNGTITVTGVSP
jgi:hypothetical protein